MNQPSIYREKYVAMLSLELVKVTAILGATKNTAVLGAYAETVVRGFVRNMLAPMRVSHGTVLSADNIDKPDSHAQFDAIVWAPLPMPALFEEGDFAVVPKESTRGIIEIKRTDYDDGLKDIETKYEEAQTLIPGNPYDAFRGVICIRKYHDGARDNRLTRLVQGAPLPDSSKRGHKKAVFLLEEGADGNIVPNPAGVLDFLEFLLMLHYFHEVRLGHRPIVMHVG
jgi:hypothetical protein